MKAILKPLALYAGAAGLCLLLLAFVLRLWEADLRVPFLYYGDGVWNLVWAKGLLENGWYLHNDYLAAPGTMDSHDFPLVDSLFFLILKVLVHAANDFTLGYNLYFLLTFPLTALSSLFVLRRFGVSAGPALVAALLYTFLPYHLLRGEGHIFLASYFLVPLAVLLMLRVYLDQRIHWLGAVAVCLLLGCGGIYYAFFSCFLLLVAGSVAALQRHKLAPLRVAALQIAVICIAVGANLMPTVLYQREHGRNPEAVKRSASHSDLMSIKPAQMVLPVDKHLVARLAHVKQRYNGHFGLDNPETGSCTLGLVASAGFLLLLVRLLARRLFAEPDVTDALATLNAAALLLACIGGAGSLFSLFVSPMIRGYSRICVFIAFFALLALAGAVTTLDDRLRSPRWRWAYHAALAVVLVLGVLDQCPPAQVPPYARLKGIYTAESEFVARVEATLPPGSMVFQLPSLTFPEGPLNQWFSSTDLFRCYLHSRTLRWSHGTVRGREGDRWREQVAAQPLPEMVRTLVEVGFRGIVIDRAGYSEGVVPHDKADLGAGVRKDLTQLLGSEPLESSDERFLFFDLSAYAERLKQSSGGQNPALSALPEGEAGGPVRSGPRQ